MLATYDLLAAFHTGCASETLPSPDPPRRGGDGGNFPLLGALDR